MTPTLNIEHAENITLQISGSEGQQAFSQLLAGLLAKRAASEATAAPAPSAAAQAPSSPILLTPPALGQYWQGQGGIYVGTVPSMLDVPGHHLIASADETRLAWGPYDEDASATSHTNGPANSSALAAAGDKYPAARWAAEYSADGHKDFHLPSRFDLLVAYLSTGSTVFEKDGWYWSSTQVSRTCAFVQDFADGDSDWGDKASECRVRAFRWIHFNA